jgi:hypothetical protein
MFCLLAIPKSNLSEVVFECWEYDLMGMNGRWRNCEILLLWSHESRTDYLVRDISVMHELTYYHNDESTDDDTLSYCAYYVCIKGLERRAKVKLSDSLRLNSVM